MTIYSELKERIKKISESEPDANFYTIHLSDIEFELLSLGAALESGDPTQRILALGGNRVKYYMGVEILIKKEQDDEKED